MCELNSPLPNSRNTNKCGAAVLCLVAQLCLTLCDPMDCSLPGSSGDSPGKNTGVGWHALLRGIFRTQGFNPGLPHCKWILYHLNHQWSPLLKLNFTNSQLYFHFWVMTFLTHLLCLNVICFDNFRSHLPPSLWQ